MSFNSINFSKIDERLTFTVTDANFVFDFPDGTDKLWSATVNAHRKGVICDIFKSILFVESLGLNQGTAYIYGIEFEDGYPHGLNTDWARKQQTFIEFLRCENAQNIERMGIMGKLFSGSEYACEKKVTFAYLRLRDVNLNIGVGYVNDAGEYQREAFPSSDWM